MSEYIKWFVEKVMQKEYEANDSLELWEVQRTSHHIKEFKKVNISITKQLTIFDCI